MSDPALYTASPTEISSPPTEHELLCDDGIPMETHRHKLQMDLLVDPLITWLVLDQGRGFVGGNMFVYFSPEQVRNQDYRGPDVFVVLDAPVRERKSWVVWQEGKGPDVVIELLSDSTAARDKAEKKQIYQTQLRVPEYFWFNPFEPNDLAGFSLQRGIYEPIQPDSQGNVISQQLGLMLIRWTGSFKAVETTWLRWSTLDGQPLPTDQEQAALAQQQTEDERQRADGERQRADSERQRAEDERQRAERLAARLRALGVDPEAI
ncbi:MAG: Uma2 family endonuclease [Leptolyngbya sp. SIO1D8]|nr:Uma2 family endonuclease [Leptolyngbya sp. SIO1D8]